ncbi:hypothetical protein IID23_00610 [Patescibacteria group bacterium]|nr:hypothetical protein [Patescibacteria group bacterium]
MRIWLDGNSEDPKFKERVREAGVKELWPDKRTGKAYFEFYGDPFDPTAEIPELPDDLVTHGTYKGRIYRGLRRDALYVKGEARLLLTTEDRGDTTWQEVDVRAPTVTDLIEIYRLVRTGELSPELDFEKDIKEYNTLDKLARRVLENHEGINPSFIREVREDPSSELWQIVRGEIETVSPESLGLMSGDQDSDIFELAIVSLVLERVTKLVKETPIS